MTHAERMAEIKARCEASQWKLSESTCPSDIPYLLARLEALEALVEAAYCEGYEDSKDHGSHWSNSVSRAALEGEDNG